MNEKLEQEAITFYNIPLDCRIRILSYLSPTDLYANYAHCSISCHADSLDSGLPQTKWGEFHVGMHKTDTDELSEQKEISMESLLQRIIHPSFQNAWHAPRCHMKILGHEHKGAIVVSARIDDLSFEEMQQITSEVAFEDVTSLTMSVSNEINEEDSQCSLNRALPRSLPWLLSAILPGLVELDFSNLHGSQLLGAQAMHEGDYISELSLFNSSNTPNIRKISWNNRVDGCYFLRGKDMRSLDHLSELYLDNVLCDWRFDKLFAPLMNQFFDETSIIQRFFFFACNKSLQRVSLKGGKYVAAVACRSSDIIDFPQWALVRFVRRTTSLKWFRSDLTQENIKLLSRERPEIHFCD
eukprot:CAMPEP_0172309128 /NCGR_PEP_ID=MMETSP1058-20130122/9507_1 /TAXON_ID=83371 /ORGANISM="Detonula confervacea, Strain CCMP 353" /LENGTH=353 /DNA_ID=CAMNT_0013021691 /DNA_START=98 /DNA_END=1159 /DNA_ORIENTATION=+